MFGKNKIFIIFDYRKTFYSSTKEVAGSMDIQKLKLLLEEKGYFVEAESFSEVNFSSNKYKGSFILYQSSEDPDLRYKDYIEDVLLGLKLKGATLVPDIYKFRAHHNKVFMEILRSVSDCKDIKNLSSRVYGTAEEFIMSSESLEFPVVFKPGFGAKGSLVAIVNSSSKAGYYAKKISRSFSLINIERFFLYIIQGKLFKPISGHRRKFIVQNFIPGLSFDYKVLVYGDKIFVLQRENRIGDFRASGSGLNSFPSEPPEELLDYAKKVFSFFETPFVSMDIGFKKGTFFLFEFQFISFGQYALEKSPFFFKKDGGKWKKVVGSSDLEESFVEAVDMYIQSLKS